MPGSSAHQPACVDLLHRLSAVAADVLRPGETRSGRDLESLRARAGSAAVRLAVRHRLAPLLHEATRRIPDGGALAAALAPSVRESVLVSAVVLEELRRVSSALGRRGVPHLAFKGAALARSAYPNAAWRPFVDVDLLLPGACLGTAEGALAAEGYAPRDSPRHDWFRREHYHLTYSRGPERPSVELHWRLARRGWHLDALWERIWARPVTVPMDGQGIRTPALEEHFVAVCVHGAKHGWNTLMWVIDLVALVAAGLDADHVDEVATATGCRGFLHAALLIAEQWTGRDLLPKMTATARDDEVAVGFARRWIERVSAEAEERLPPPVELEAGLLRERWLDRTYFHVMRARGRWVMWILPTATDRRWAHLPRWLSALYYLVRPLRVASQAVARMGRRAR